MSLIFDRSRKGRRAGAQSPANAAAVDLPKRFRRARPAPLPEVSELDCVRHYTGLSQKNFSIDTHFYPLGSCTMKYNPRGAHRIASLPGLVDRHPATPETHAQGLLACLYELQEAIAEVTGMAGVSLAGMAGAQGEFAGMAMIRAYHLARGDAARTEVLVPDAAHGTNPATATMCGYTVREIPTDAEGDVDIDALRAAVGPRTAALMLTNPSTLGVFERRVKEITDMVHAAGGLLYYDGANLNAILGKVRPGDMGFDAIHVNLHKTFATPHGGGGPGAAAVGVSERLLPFLPVPLVKKGSVPFSQEMTSFSSAVDREKGTDPFFIQEMTSSSSAVDREKGTDPFFTWLDEAARPQTIGRLSAFAGNVGVLLRAWAYVRMLGPDGMTRVADYSTLNANYLMARLREMGFDVAFPKRRATHEFIVTLERQKRECGVTAMDVAKRLLDFGFHAPTTYFPMLVPECLLIEPTETESRETLDAFADALAAILAEARETPDRLKGAPWTLPNRRFDEVRAARELDVCWKPPDAP